MAFTDDERKRVIQLYKQLYNEKTPFIPRILDIFKEEFGSIITEQTVRNYARKKRLKVLPPGYWNKHRERGWVKRPDITGKIDGPLSAGQIRRRVGRRPPVYGEYAFCEPA